MSTPRISAEFVISGFDCDPVEVSRGLQITPTDTWRAGELIRAPDVRQKSSGWRLRSPVEDMLDVEPHLRWLLDRLPPESLLLPGCEGWTADFSVGITVSDQTPGMSIPRDVLERIARLGADLDFDVVIAEP
jgi:uncharacterized protein DUF4279